MKSLLCLRGCAYVLAILLLHVIQADAAPRSWTGSSGNDWFVDGNWDPSGVPQAGDAVTLGGTCILTNSTDALLSLTISSGTLTCSNWSTVISASDVVIQNGAKIRLSGAFTTAQTSNRINIACSALTVDSGGQIDASECGYNVNYGPGVGQGTDNVGGGGYGGRGGYAIAGANPNSAGGGTYGSEPNPNEPGSAGAMSYPNNFFNSGKGGGVIRIEAAGGIVTVNGTISANGGNPIEGHAGGGSGGAIYINCSTFTGSSSGLISANGGNRSEGGNAGGGGGGGRIAVIYTSCNLPSVRLSAARGTSHFDYGDETSCAQMGSVYLSDSSVLSTFVTSLNGRLIVPSFSSWSPSSLVVSNCDFSLGSSFTLTVAGNLTVTGSTAGLRLGTGCSLKCSNLVLNGRKVLLETNSNVNCNSGSLGTGQFVLRGDMTCGTDLTLANGGVFYAYSLATNGLSTNYGSRIVVTGSVSLAASSWIYPNTHPSDGGSPIFEMQNLTIASGAGFNAIGRGYGIEKGPGTPDPGGRDNASGASHGGKGTKGSNNNALGNTYGSSNAPLTAGSGSGNCYVGEYGTGKGGGVVRMEVSNLLTLNGTIDASGAAATDGHGAGGAGGSVFVITRRLHSDAGSFLYAKGGNGLGNGGAGGGGRTAIWVGSEPSQVYQFVNSGSGLRPDVYTKFLGTSSVAGGSGYNSSTGDSGTICMFQFVRRGTVIMIQ